MTTRPAWCPHSDCEFIRNTQDFMCCGKLPKPEEHDGVFNTHRFCLDIRETGHGIFDLQVNRADAWYLKLLMEAVMKSADSREKEKEGDASCQLTQQPEIRQFASGSNAAPKQFDPLWLAAIHTRFWPQVTIADKHSCWIWTGAQNHNGYGRIKIDERLESAHRVAFLLTRCAWPPKGALVCHRCDIPRCVNPSHLFLGTHQGNVDDCKSKGRFKVNYDNLRHPKGSANPAAKLTESQVQMIRTRAASESHKTLAVEFGVNPSTIDRIAKGESWKQTK